MSGQWQQYPPNPGGYQQQAGYNPQMDYSQGGYAQSGYRPEVGYPPQGSHAPSYHQQAPAGNYPHPHPGGYPQHQGHSHTPQHGYPQPPQQTGYPQAQQNAMYSQGGFQDGSYRQPSAGAFPQQGAYYQQQPAHPHAQGFHQRTGPYDSPAITPYGPYPNQQFPSQPYPHPNYQASHQPPTPSYQPPQQFSPTQQGSSPNASNSCFNCGAPDHWAQDCPEPRRQVPYGQAMQANRPQKRFRPPYKPPIITKYPVPPHVANAQPTPPNSAPPAWNQVSQPYPTPSTAVPSPAHSWPEPSPHQNDSARYPQISTPDSQGQKNEHRRLSGLPHDVLTPPYGTEQAVSTNESRPAMLHKQEKPPASTPMSRDHSKASASTNQSVSMASDSDDEDDDEYLRLDIPDLPNLNCYGGAKPPQLVAEPLPALSETDDLDKLARPTNERVRSRYYDAAWADLLEANVRNRGEFEGLEDDPIFRIIADDQPQKQREREPAAPKRSPRASPQIKYSRRSSRSASPARDRQTWRSRSRSRRGASPTKQETPNEKSAPRSREGTPINKPEYQDGKPSSGFDPFDPATGHLDDLIRKLCPEDVHKKNDAEVAPPPPPPPPPPGSYYPHEYSNGSSLRRNGYSSRSLEGTSNWGGDGHTSPPSDPVPRKRKPNGENASRREGQRQRDTTTKRRTAPKVEDVYR